MAIRASRFYKEDISLMAEMKEIYPIFNLMTDRSLKEQRLNQKSMAIWLTGLSGSGKSTIALGLEKRLFSEGFYCQILDGDNTRIGISNNLQFSDEDRKENIRRVSEISKLFVEAGIITINSFISPTFAIRAMAKNIIGDDNFLEVYVKASVSVCEKRDVKGLYKKARNGEIINFTGIDAPYEEPKKPEHIIHSEETSPSEAIEGLYHFINPYITLLKET